MIGAHFLIHKGIKPRNGKHNGHLTDDRNNIYILQIITIGFRSFVWAYFRSSASGDNRFWCFGCTRNNHGTLLRVRVQSPFSKREMSFLSLSKGEKGKMGQALSVRHVHEFRYCDKNTWAILGLRSDTSEKGDSRPISEWQKTFNLNDVSGSNRYMGNIFFRYKICAIKF